MRPNRNVRASSLIPHPSSFPRRRGVLLLLVLALLALFALIGLAFVLIATHAGRSARSLETINQTELGTDPAPKLINRAIRDFLRGENPPAAGSSPMSIVGADSLLEDMYGNNPITGTIATIQGTIAGSPRMSTQLLKLTVTPLTFAQICAARRLRAHDHPQHDTVVGRPGLGRPEHADRRRGHGRGGRLVLGHEFAAGPQRQQQQLHSGWRGRGSGHQRRAVQRDGLRLCPHRRHDSGVLPQGAVTRAAAEQPHQSHPRVGTPASANSDYTAPDFQHVFLAAQVANSAAAGGIQTLPSFQRSALVNYWINKTWQLILRPALAAEPNSLPRDYDAADWAVCRDD